MSLQTERWRYAGPITPRQLQVLAEASLGKTSRQIALELGIGHDTAKRHLQHACAALEARNTAHAVAKAFEQGLLR